MSPVAVTDERVDLAVDIQRVSKTFPGQRALDDVAFSIRNGEIHALLGENGSGKSTLIKILAGIYTPDSGSEIEIDGEQLAFGSPRDSARRGLRFVHQDLGLIDELTAVENMALTWQYARTSLHTIRWREQRRRTREMLDRLGVGVSVDRPIGDLRPVERTAIAIARALEQFTGRIRLLVLDEPTAALPPAEVDALFEILGEIRSQGIAVLYVSHRLDEIQRLADRATVLRDGRWQATVELSETSREELIDLIVGHEPETSIIAVDGEGHVEPPTAAPGPELFRIEDLRGGRLDGVGFAVNEGEIVGVAGLTGSGREEVAEGIVGAIPGHVRLVDVRAGRVHDGMSPRKARDAGVVLVLPNRSAKAAVSELTARENVTLPSLGRFSRLGFLRKGREALEALRLIEMLDVRPPRPEHLFAFFSGGNQQKLIFAKWLAITPRLMVLEDPTSGVDVGARARIYELIREQAVSGVGVVLVSSDIEDLVSVATTVHVIAHGRVGETLTGDQITESGIIASLNRSAERTFSIHTAEGSTP